MGERGGWVGGGGGPNLMGFPRTYLSTQFSPIISPISATPPHYPGGVGKFHRVAEKRIWGNFINGLVASFLTIAFNFNFIRTENIMFLQRPLFFVQKICTDLLVK
jgi:hypothetical protein